MIDTTKRYHSRRENLDISYWLVSVISTHTKESLLWTRHSTVSNDWKLMFVIISRRSQLAAKTKSRSHLSICRSKLAVGNMKLFNCCYASSFKKADGEIILLSTSFTRIQLNRYTGGTLKFGIDTMYVCGCLVKLLFRYYLFLSHLNWYEPF